MLHSLIASIYGFLMI